VRALDLSRPGFRRDLKLYAPKGSAAYAAVLVVLRELGAAGPRDLPGPEDVLVRLAANVMARPVPGTSLVVAYVAGPDVLHAMAIVPR
jgi:hypothetical protein